MYIDTSELCDIYADQVDVVEANFFLALVASAISTAKVTTVKMF